MRYQSPLRNDGYGHELYYGENVFAELTKGMLSFIRSCKLSSNRFDQRNAEFWLQAWQASNATIEARLATQRARAIFVHHCSAGVGLDQWPWNSLFIASPDYIGNELNCEFFGNDFGGLVSTHVDWTRYRESTGDSAADTFNKDQWYLAAIRPMNPLPAAASPGIATTMVTMPSPQSFAVQSGPRARSFAVVPGPQPQAAILIR